MQSFPRVQIPASCLFIVLFAALTARGAPPASPQTVNDLMAAPEAADPVGEITLREAMALALQRNPALAAFEWDLRAAEARELQASLYPNPELTLSIEEIRWAGGSESISETLSMSALGPSVGVERSRDQGAHSGFAEAEFTLELSQTFLLGKKIAKRRALAQADKALVDWDYRIARLNVLSEVSSAFIVVLNCQARVELAKELLALAKQVHAVVQARVEAGKVSPIDLTKADIALTSAQVAFEQARHRLESARLALAATWGAEEARFESAWGKCDCMVPVPDLAWLEEQLAENPELKRWMAELDRREAALRIERANRLPDITATLGLRARGLADQGGELRTVGTEPSLGLSRTRTHFDEDKDTSLVMGLSLPLPVFDRNQGAIREAEAYVSKTADERRATEVNVRTALRRAYKSLQSTHREAGEIRASILPKAQEVFTLTEEGYRQGKFGYIEVLDAQRTLFDVRTRLLGATEAYHLAEVEVERLIGQPLSCLFHAWSSQDPEEEEP